MPRHEPLAEVMPEIGTRVVQQTCPHIDTYINNALISYIDIVSVLSTNGVQCDYGWCVGCAKAVVAPTYLAGAKGRSQIRGLHSLLVGAKSTPVP
jgi:hypothetical protein